MHSAITIVCPLRNPLELEAADRELRALGRELQHSQNAELNDLVATARVHFMSFFAIPGLHGVGPAYVALEINCDGRKPPFLKLLAEIAPSMLSAIFKRCDGFPAGGDPRAVAEFLRQRDIGADAFYIGCPGRSVGQVEEELDLRSRLARALDEIVWPGSAVQLWHELQSHLSRLDPARLIERTPARPFWVRFRLHPDGLGKQLESCVRAGWDLASCVLGSAGFAGLLGSLALAPLAQLSAALAPAALATWLVPFWWSESPTQLSFDGRLLVLRSLGREWWAWTRENARTMGLLAVAPLLLPGLPLALTWLTGALGLALIAVGSGVIYIAFGELPALLFGVNAAGAWLLLSAINPLTPIIPAAVLTGSTLVFATLAGAAAACALLALRRQEQDEEEGELAWELEHFQRVEAAEDEQLQNHLITVSRLKPGALRPYALRLVLRAVSLLAKVYFNHGDLGSIRSIHFARFVILPDKQRLLFLSNYDGAFGAYLDDFHSVPGVTAVWSNTVGFPRSSFLIGDGALDEQRFKAFARRDQLPSGFWYSAYPNLSVQDIDAATRVREDLGRKLVAAKGLLERMRQRFNPTLDEAACDAALRRI